MFVCVPSFMQGNTWGEYLIAHFIWYQIYKKYSNGRRDMVALIDASHECVQLETSHSPYAKYGEYMELQGIHKRRTRRYFYHYSILSIYRYSLYRYNEIITFLNSSTYLFKISDLPLTLLKYNNIPIQGIDTTK